MLPDEVIVVDDGSNDDTKVVLKEFDVKYFYQPNGGVSSARNLGIQKASGDLIFFLDSDDEWDNSKLQEQVLFHEKNPKILFSHTNETWIKNSKFIKQSKKHKKPTGFCFDENLAICKIGASCICVHKDVFKKVGVFEESLQICEDYEFYLRVLNFYELGLIDLNLTNKYAGHEQLSFSCGNIDEFRLKALDILLNKDISQPNKKLILNEIKRKEKWK